MKALPFLASRHIRECGHSNNPISPTLYPEELTSQLNAKDGSGQQLGA
jgi:hypothetical protein